MPREYSALLQHLIYIECSSPLRSVMTSARVSGRHWLLVFERQAPPIIDYLMGYTGGSDTLAQVELHFPTRDAAITYAERQKLNYTVVDDRSRHP